MNPASAALVDHHLHAIRRQLLLNDPRPGERFSLGAMVRGMAVEKLPGFERNVLTAAAENAGQSFDPQRVTLPWSILQRDLTVGTSTDGGYLVGTDAIDPRDVLRGFSVTAAAGVTVIPGLQANTNIPRATTAPAAMVLADEATEITEGAPVLGVSALAPKNLGVYVEFSRQLMLQSPIADQFVRMILLGAIGQLLDQQILQGAGTGGEMTGLFVHADVQTQSGTSLNLAGATTMTKLSAEAGARDAEVAFIATPAVRQLLQAREVVAASGRYVWMGDRVVDRPGYASNDVPTAGMIVGPWPQVIVGMWGPGPIVEINPYTPKTNWQTGIIGARVLLSADMSPIAPQAFVKSESIT